MSEKRFLLDKLEKGNAILSVKITDSVSDDNYFIMTKDFYEDDINELVDCLNEQQATINELKEEMVRLHKIIEQSKRYEDGLWVRFTRLEKENEQLRRLFEEMKQPITINLTEEDEKELRKLLGLIDDE